MTIDCFDGGIAFLDTYEGTCALVAASYEDWKAMLESQDRMEDWFRVSLIGELLEAGQTRAAAQCFSPFVPQIVGGSWESSNFHACNLVVHLTMLSQVHQQVKDLPPGTRIAGFDLVDE